MWQPNCSAWSSYWLFSFWLSLGIIQFTESKTKLSRSPLAYLISYFGHEGLCEDNNGVLRSWKNLHALRHPQKNSPRANGNTNTNTMADDHLTTRPTPTYTHQTTAHHLYVNLWAVLDDSFGPDVSIAGLLLIRRPRRINLTQHTQQPTAL